MHAKSSSSSGFVAPPHRVQVASTILGFTFGAGFRRTVLTPRSHTMQKLLLRDEVRNSGHVAIL